MLKKHRSFEPIKHTHPKGFTLIELSVVMVVIGLVTAGVLVGRSLIRTSEVMSVIVDEDKYYKAARAFRDKYNALPGDMVNATTYWGAYTSCPPGNAAVTAPQAATCNGNGNGLIDSLGSVASNNVAMWEHFSAWQQLANAGFIQGGYTGTATSGGSVGAVSPGLNAPASKVQGAGFEWMAFTASGRYTNPTLQFSLATIVLNQQYLLFGQPSGAASFDLIYPTLTGPEAASIDTKIDDGVPSTGLLLGGGTGTPNCASSTTAYYTGSGIVCYLLFSTPW